MLVEESLGNEAHDWIIFDDENLFLHDSVERFIDADRSRLKRLRRLVWEGWAERSAGGDFRVALWMQGFTDGVIERMEDAAAASFAAPTRLTSKN